MISSLECFGFPVGFLHQLPQEDELVAVGVSMCAWQRGTRCSAGVNTCLRVKFSLSHLQLEPRVFHPYPLPPGANSSCDAVCQNRCSSTDSPSPWGRCPVGSRPGSFSSYLPCVPAAGPWPDPYPMARSLSLRGFVPQLLWNGWHGKWRCAAHRDHANIQSRVVQAPGPGWGCLSQPQLLDPMDFVRTNDSASLAPSSPSDKVAVPR